MGSLTTIMDPEEKIRVVENLHARLGNNCISGIFIASESECQNLWELKRNRSKTPPSPQRRELDSDIESLLYRWDSMSSAQHVDAANRTVHTTSCRRCKDEKRVQRAASHLYEEFRQRIKYMESKGIPNVKPTVPNTEAVESEGKVIHRSR